MIAVVVSAILWAVGAIVGRSLPHRTPVAMFAGMQMMAGGALLLIVGGITGEHFNAAEVGLRAWVSLAYMIVFGSILAFSAYQWLLQVSSAAKVAVHCYVNPIVAVFLGWMFAGEPVTARMLAGAGIVLASVALVNLKSETPVEPLVEA